MTLLLSILIFGSVGWIVYRQFRGDSSCNDCSISCPAKQKQQK